MVAVAVALTIALVGACDSSVTKQPQHTRHARHTHEPTPAPTITPPTMTPAQARTVLNDHGIDIGRIKDTYQIGADVCEMLDIQGVSVATLSDTVDWIQRNFSVTTRQAVFMRGVLIGVYCADHIDDVDRVQEAR